MRTIKFKVTGQHIECTETISDLVGNTREYVMAQFTLSQEWDGLLQIAVFTANGKSYPVLIENGRCEVPYKVMMGEVFTVGCYAGAVTDRITTDICTIRVEKSVRIQTGREYRNPFETMQKMVDELKMYIEEHEKKVEETMLEHCGHKTHTSDGAHDLRIHDGRFQYYDDGWKDTQVAAAQEQHNWLASCLLRFIGQYDIEGQIYHDSFTLEEKGYKEARSLTEVFTMGWTMIVYAKAGKNVYEWRVHKDSDDNTIIEPMFSQGNQEVSVYIQWGRDEPHIMYENTSANGDSVEIAEIKYIEKQEGNDYEEVYDLDAEWYSAINKKLTLRQGYVRLIKIGKFRRIRAVATFEQEVNEIFSVRFWKNGNPFSLGEGLYTNGTYSERKVVSWVGTDAFHTNVNIPSDYFVLEGSWIEG